jgi:hypothetical protein
LEHRRACIGPTFKPHLVYSEDDVRTLRSMGVATETEAIEEFIGPMRQLAILSASLFGLQLYFAVGRNALSQGFCCSDGFPFIFFVAQGMP